ncbi:IS4 family transposase [Vibrio hippocampi]|uniref:IS4 family transposase ISCro2 n=1 Tax=Vibrio hippocampi TaxID=654686 RepID=A0ABM8ZGG4_9VIBR|nr:IS4 family transposase [Vibrio hippocampi]CAH0525726.1 IS4 family transposase ISCro2 [Vibrio hippocampi]
MLISKFCHKILARSLKNFNQARVKTLLDCSNALIRGNELSLTTIGRNIEGPSAIKHKIKRTDRFLGNTKLQSELLPLYKALSSFTLNAMPFIVIAVDWSGCCNRDFWLLRASLLVDGRAIPIFNTVVTAEEQEKEYVHNQFLDSLFTILPKGKPVYIVTDGGFKTPWFSKVASLGWFFLGRVRGRIHGQVKNGTWKSVPELNMNASSRPHGLGFGKLGKTSKTQVECFFHLFKAKSKHRHNKKRRKSQIYPDAERTYKSIANEPWLLVTNDANLSPQKAVIYYSKRMQIEQNFRDDKSQRYGFSWHHSKTLGAKRIAVLCLIACVATLVLWLVGFESERQK